MEQALSMTKKHTFTNFHDVYTYIKNFTDYECMAGIRYTKQNYNLDKMRRLLKAIGNPEKQIKSIHIAGTKGKGSTAIMVESILRKAGFKTGLYTSPHLVSMLERIQINGSSISDADFVWAMNVLKPHLDKSTYFEIMTAVAFLLFAREKVDFAIIEVGLGGRLDSTNVIKPIVTAITTIDYDHQDQLGKTLGSIAREKAGIIKPSIPVVISPQRKVALNIIRKTAQLNDALLREVGRDIKVDVLPKTSSNILKCDITTSNRIIKNISLPLIGRHQLDNVATAIGILNVLVPIYLPAQAGREGLRISNNTIKKCLKEFEATGSD